tara:strand:- start:341 stop:571 length:231 start_codon:yes stop_codon:yes gene_type:complete
VAGKSGCGTIVLPNGLRLNRMSTTLKKQIYRLVEEEIGAGNCLSTEDIWINAISEVLELSYWDVAENLDHYLMEIG